MEFKLNPKALKFIPKQKHVIYLNNIRSISKHYSSKYNKNIYIFGEIHSENSICKSYGNKENTNINIPDHLKEYFTKYSGNISMILSKYLELYLEHDMNFYITKDEWIKLINKIWLDKDGKWPNNNQKSSDMFIESINIIRKKLVYKYPMLIRPFNVIDIDEFINIELNRDKSIYIDFFLETKYKTKIDDCKDIRSGNSYNLDMFDMKYKDCLCPSKIKCLYKNIRFHYIDIRFNQNIFLNKLRESIFSDNFVSKLNEIFKTPESIEYKNLKNKKDFLEYGLKEYSKSKLLKQYENIPYPEVKIKLLEFLNKYLDKVDLNDITYTNIMKIILNKNLTEKDHEKLKLNFIIYLTGFMDMYTLSRIFRKFKQQENIYSEEPKNIIIFSGNAHANNYRSILNDLGFTNNIYRDNKDNCIKISLDKLKLPIFS